MEICLLGPLEVRNGSSVVALPRRQQRALLAALALRAGEVVSTDRLIADLWGERAPASAAGSLQNTVSGVRKLLGHEVLVRQAPGYRLALPRDAVDANRFETLLAQAGQAELPMRVALLREALALWRGPALADLDEEDFARLEAARLDDLRVTALEQRIEAELELGRHGALVGELEQLVATHPLRERLRGQLMLALYRCGRQAEALEAYRVLRLALADELGLDPSPELQALERRMLQQDPSLDPPAEVAEEAAQRPSAELRLVTVLAAVPPSADDPERHRLLLDETLANVRDVLDRHGGELERFGPEGLVAVFGAETPRDDDAERACLAARELGLPTGVATGETLRGAGPVVARAVGLARSGGVRLDERTAAIVRTQRRLDAPLVGRREDLERLQLELEAARDAGACRVVTVVGEPGIGKTRLARELVAREGETATVLVARCLAHGDGATFLPLLAALRRAEPERALEREPDADLVLARLGALAEGEAPLGESYWAVRRLLEALARDRPVLLVVDDVHWAEPALLDLVDYLRDRAAAPLLVLCLSRPEVERIPGEPLALGPLAQHEAHEIAGAADLDQATRSRIVDAAEGNPFFLEQLAAFAAEGGEGLPPSLEAVLAGRLGRLEPGQRAVLQRAAVMGREFTLGAVAALSGGEVARELLALSRAGFVHPAAAADPGDDGYSFHHVLLRDAAYAGLTKADRAELHERAAAWIDRDGPGDDAIAGYHLEQAVRYRRELGEDADELAATAGERLGQAGMRMWRTNDVAAAVGLLGRAASLLPAGELRAELLWERSIALRIHGRDEESSEALALAEGDAATAGAAAVAFRVDAERAYQRLNKGELALADALETFTGSAVGLRRAADARGLGRAEMFKSHVHLLAGRYDEVMEAARRAEPLYASAGFSAAAPIGTQAESTFYGALPVPAALRACASLLERCTDRAATAWVTAVLGGLRALEGNLADARLLLDEARTTFAELGNERAILATWTPLAVELEAVAGGDPVALARQSAEALRAFGDAAYSSTHTVILAELLVERGEAAEADELCALAEREALDSDVVVQFRWRSVRGLLLAHAGALEAAERVASDAVSIASHTDALRDRARAHAALAGVLLAAGERTRAAAERKAARGLLRAKGATALHAGLAAAAPVA